VRLTASPARGGFTAISNAEGGKQELAVALYSNTPWLDLKHVCRTPETPVAQLETPAAQFEHPWRNSKPSRDRQEALP